MQGLLDEVWYVDAEPDRRLGDLVARHVAHGRSEQDAAAWVARSDEANARLIPQTAARADLLVLR